MKHTLYTTLFLMVAAGSCVAQNAATAAKFTSNDVSWLFPPPSLNAKTEEIDTKLISLASMLDSGGKPVLSNETFSKILAIAEEAKFQVPGEQGIKLPNPAKNQAGWKVVAFRFDPSAPGFDRLAKDGRTFREVFGELPQIRLIVQPVEIAKGKVLAHDAAMHLIFNFAVPDPTVPDPKLRKGIPDPIKVSAILQDLLNLKKISHDAGVDTSGSLRVHPGLQSSVAPELLKELRAFFSRHLTDARLGAAAVMGLHPNGREPWIFIPMLRRPGAPVEAFPQTALASNDGFAQMLSFISGAEKIVFPKPSTNNLGADPVLPGKLTEREGVSTAPLFIKSLDLESNATIAEGKTHPKAKNKDIADIIANPRQSHFFNTDCVSCHSETTRRTLIPLPMGEFAFKIDGKVPEISPSVLPKGKWNVRNFGWFQPFAGEPIQPTATQRTANETAEVVEHLNNLKVN